MIDRITHLTAALALVVIVIGTAPASADPIQFCGQTIDEKTTELDCTDHSVSDLAPLAGATWLEELDLRMTAVTDLSPLVGLTKLTELDIRGTKVTNLAPLAKLTSLQKLTLQALAVTDLKPLAGLPLVSLDLAMIKATDLAPLAKIATLMDLDLSDTKIKNIKPLAKLTNLDQVDLRGNKVPKAAAKALGKHARLVYWGTGEDTFGTDVH